MSVLNPPRVPFRDKGVNYILMADDSGNIHIEFVTMGHICPVANIDLTGVMAEVTYTISHDHIGIVRFESKDLIRDFVSLVETWKAIKRGPVKSEEVGDGYHTLSELYDHRAALFAALCSAHHEHSFCAKRQHDGVGSTGYFLAGINHPQAGLITYHIQDKFRGVFNLACGTVYDDRCLIPYDGHTSDDVLNRLAKLASVDAHTKSTSAR